MTSQLELYRQIINGIDEELVRVTARRLQICREVALFKKAAGIPMMQPARVEEVKARAALMGQELGLSDAFIRDLYERIIHEACRLEEEIIGR